MNRKIQILFIVLMVLYSKINGQETLNNLKFTALGVNEGLSQNSVWDIIQTNDGFMWIGTSDGINRYDGNSFKVYKHEEGNSNTITGQNFTKLYEDKNKNLWVSDDRGVSCYKKVKDCFENVYLLKKTPMIANSNCFIGEDNANGLIIFLADKIIARFDINTHKITKVINLDTFNLGTQIYFLNKPIVINNIAYLSLNENNLLAFDLIKLQPVFYSYKEKIGKAIIKFSASELLFLNNDTFTVFNTITKKIAKFKSKKGVKPPPNFSPNSANLYNGKYWYSCVNGMYVFDVKTLQFTQHLKSFSNSFFNEKDDYTYVYLSYTDQSNNLWICTNGDGLKIYSPYKNKFPHYKTKSKKVNLVKGICSANNELVFIASYLQQLHVLNKKTGNFKELNLLNPLKFSSGTITCLTPICNNRIIFVLKKSLYTYNYKTQKVELLIDENKPPFSTIYYSSLNSYSSFYKVSPNEIYSNIGNRIFKLSFSPNGKFEYKSIFEVKDKVSSCLQFDSKGKLWIGTMSGIIIVDSTLKSWFKLSDKWFIKSLFKAKNNKMYAATQSGLLVFENYKQIANYTTKNGLPADFTYGVLEDKKGNIWISHNKGLSCLNPTKNSYTHYTIHDGLQSSEFNTGAFYKDDFGLLYFGGINGINVFNPEAIISNPHLPKVQFTAIKLFEEALKTDSNISVITQIKLPYFNNTLSFDFAALEYSNSQLNQYAYMLEGYDNDWIYSGNKHYSRYANLPFGNYVFKVKAANADGVWNNESKNLSIIITPPFWRTFWFYFLTVLSVFVTLVLVIFYVFKLQKVKLKRKLEIQNKLEQERIRISRDLHDNVGAQLSYLITNVEWILQHPNQMNEAAVNERLKVLSETGRNAIITLRQTIWAISSNTLSMEDFTDRFKQFALKMIEFNKNIELVFSDNLTENNNLSPAIALNLFRICQEAFNNCLKHANCTKINIDFISNREHLFLFEIIDNGVGFDMEVAKLKGHYGLKNMQSRATENGAELTFESELGKGTTLKLCLKK
ncbi:MAG: sensor histidine kinase [Bacteroidia bacterium]